MQLVGKVSYQKAQRCQNRHSQQIGYKESKAEPETIAITQTRHGFFLVNKIACHAPIVA